MLLPLLTPLKTKTGVVIGKTLSITAIADNACKLRDALKDIPGERTACPDEVKQAKALLDELCELTKDEGSAEAFRSKIADKAKLLQPLLLELYKCLNR